MKLKALFTLALAASAIGATAIRVHGQADALPAPGFHHLHLNSTNPEKAIDWYVKAFPVNAKTTWGGQPALKAPNNVLILFNTVDQPPATQPQTAVWHFGWHVLHERETMARLRDIGVTLL